jgi:hypothetical protein
MSIRSRCSSAPPSERGGGDDEATKITGNNNYEEENIDWDEPDLPDEGNSHCFECFAPIRFANQSLCISKFLLRLTVGMNKIVFLLLVLSWQSVKIMTVRIGKYLFFFRSVLIMTQY